MDLTSSLEAKFGARSSQVHQIRGKTWEVLLPQDAEVGKKSQFLGSYLEFRGQNMEYLSLIFLEAKFGAPTRISEANSEAKPPRPPDTEVPPGLQIYFSKSLNTWNFWFLLLNFPNTAF